jgi:hypothetical protein
MKDACRVKIAVWCTKQNEKVRGNKKEEDRNRQPLWDITWVLSTATSAQNTRPNDTRAQAVHRALPETCADASAAFSWQWGILYAQSA